MNPRDQQGSKRKLILGSDGEEDSDIQEVTPLRKKNRRRKKTTPVDSRGVRQPEQGEGGDEDEEDEQGEEGEEDQDQGPVGGEEPDREAGPSGNAEEKEAPLQLESILMTTRMALDLVTEKYAPLFTALREVGHLLHSDDVLEYPELIRKLQKKLHRRERQVSEAAVIVLDQKDQLQRKTDYVRRMENHLRTQEQHIKGQEEAIQRVGDTGRKCLSKVVHLFQPSGEAQTKARLYDEKVTQSGIEGAARIKNIVREYSEKVEASLVEFRWLAEEVQKEDSSGSEPAEEEANNRGERVGSGDGLQDVFGVSAEAPQEGEMDRIMRTGSSTQEHTSRPVLDVEPVHMVRPAEVSPVEPLNPEGSMGDRGTQPGSGEKSEGVARRSPGQSDGRCARGRTDRGAVGRARSARERTGCSESGGESGEPGRAAGGRTKERGAAARALHWIRIGDPDLVDLAE